MPSKRKVMRDAEKLLSDPKLTVDKIEQIAKARKDKKQ